MTGTRTDLEPGELAGLLRLLWERGRAGLMELDAEGRCVRLNAASTRMLGKEPAELTGRWVGEFLPLFDAGTESAGWASLLEEGGRIGELRIDLPFGRRRVVEYELLPGGKERSHLLVLWDLSERLELEGQRLQAQKLESIGLLAGGVAHDFNNILTVVQGHASLLQMFPELPEPARESAEQISVAAERAANVTRQLLTFSRTQALEARELDLREVVSGMSKLLQRVLGEEIALHLHFAPGLPKVLADQGMLEQVVLNLAVNSRDAMLRGGQLIINASPATVSEADCQKVPEARSGEFVRLDVTDTGSGISPENLPRIFEPFFTTKEIGRGTGLGLATVHGIARRHRGWVEVASELGRGTMFTLYWPVVSVAASHPAAPSRAASEPAAPKGAWILVVEDEEPLRALVRNLLERQGYHVLEAGSGAEALRIWPEHRDQIQLLLTDMVMPDGVSGRELGARLLAEKESIQIIYTSGYGLEVVDHEGRLREGYDFLQKPYHPKRLAEAVRTRLKKE